MNKKQLKVKAQEFGDKADCFVSHPFTVIGFCISIPTLYVTVGESTTNIYISIVTALVLFITAGTKRTDNLAVQKKLDSMVPPKLKHLESKTEDDIKEVDE